MSFDNFLCLSHHHPKQDAEYFHHPREFPHALFRAHHPSPGNHFPILQPYTSFAYSRTSCRGNHILFSLASFMQHSVSEIHLCSCVYEQFFLFLSSRPFCDYTFCLFILFLIYVWVVSSFSL